jgi:putative DNA-invertase from lambdoid prophage Rac
LGQRAALYCRVSTADQSCARQERDLTAFATRAGYEVVGVFKETGSGAKLDRAERKKVIALAQRREVDAVLVTELSRWGRSTLDLLHTRKELETWRVSVIAMNGLTFGPIDTARPHDGNDHRRHHRTRAGVDSGAGPLRYRRRKRARQAPWAPARAEAEIRSARSKSACTCRCGRSYRLISRELGLSKNTVLEIVKRNRAMSA